MDQPSVLLFYFRLFKQHFQTLKDLLDDHSATQFGALVNLPGYLFSLPEYPPLMFTFKWFNFFSNFQIWNLLNLVFVFFATDKFLNGRFLTLV